MHRLEVLKIEYEQQHHQYRWIGQQQTSFLMFYGALISASILLFGIFAKFGTSKSPDQTYLAWLGGGLVFYGVIGFFLAAFLLGSRAMQLRTAVYLSELLDEMRSLSVVGEPEGGEGESRRDAFKFRALCTSKGRFVAMDTGNVAISLAFTAGSLLFCIGASLIWTAIQGLDLFESLLYVSPAAVVILGFTLFRLIPKSLDKRRHSLWMDYDHIRDLDESGTPSESIIARQSTRHE